jgi:OmpA-OmpF porin, OOP family
MAFSHLKRQHSLAASILRPKLQGDTMIRKTLCTALALGLLSATAVQAQDYDNRFYVAPSVGFLFADSGRDTDNGAIFGLGVGKFFTPNISLDLEVKHNNLDQDSFNGQFENLSAGLMARYHFGELGDGWRPFIGFGGGMIRHNAGSGGCTGLPVGTFCTRGIYTGSSGTNGMLNLGLGIGKAINDRFTFRGEVGYRYDMDDESVKFQEDFSDFTASVGLAIALGAAPSAPAPEPTPEPAPTPAPAVDDDGDRDGVKNMDDKCPDSQAGQAVGPDGCPVKVAIDLRGVNFEFDKDRLLPESIAILDKAVEVLKAYPDIRVEVGGHTDSIGTDAYNMGLSDRRAKVVYDYLTANGIASDRLGPKGYGESTPIDTNDTKEGRAKNRRTELVIENQ